MRPSRSRKLFTNCCGNFLDVFDMKMAGQQQPEQKFNNLVAGKAPQLQLAGQDFMSSVSKHTPPSRRTPYSRPRISLGRHPQLVAEYGLHLGGVELRPLARRRSRPQRP